MHGKRTPSLVDRLIAKIAGSQLGVISLEQLLACGLTLDQVQWRIRRGQLHRLFRGVYAVGHRRLVPRAWLFAAQLAFGPSSFLSHRASAAARGLRPINMYDIDVTIIGTKARSRSRMTVHRTTQPPHPDEIQLSDGLRISSVPRMLLELATRETPEELDRLITQAARRNMLDPFAVEDVLQRHARRPGVAKLREAVAAYRPGPDRKSNLEVAFDKRRAEDPDIPEPLTNIYIGRWEIDCYWPEQRLAVELDGRPFHVARRDTERDRVKDADLLCMGIKPLRITDYRFETEPDSVMRTVRTLLGLGA
jgi:hypothetical protein